MTNAPKALAADTVGPLLVGRAFVDLEPTALAVGTADYSRILVTTPEPTVRPP